MSFENHYYADFETTKYKGQKETIVWCGALVNHYSEKPFLFRSMNQFMALLSNMEWGSKIFFHNLKFDGSFIIDWLERNGFEKFIQTVDDGSEQRYRFEKIQNCKKRGMYTCYISDHNIWYNIGIKFRNTAVIIKDSLKILPFSVDKISEHFKTYHKKTNMKYDGFRDSNTPMTPEEIEYVKNDVLVMKEAMVKFRSYNLYGDTIGACAMTKFRGMYGQYYFERDFTNLYDIKIDQDKYGSATMGEYVRKSYCGSFCYINKFKRRKKLKNGYTLDVNSLFPFQMHSSSGNDYVIGKGKMHDGMAEKKRGTRFFQRIRCRFSLKKGYLPFIKIRKSYHYNPRECLETSEVSTVLGMIDRKVELTFTDQELELVMEHYDLYDLEYLDYCEFATAYKIFDKYVNYFYEMKKNAKNSVERTIYKLLLNNIYGKFAAKIESNFRVPFIQDNVINFRDEIAFDAKPGYIPNGSLIVSNARVFMIRICQKNYHGKGKGFIYCDTDSLHTDQPLHKILGVQISNDDLGKFKLENHWKQAFYDNEKRYIQYVDEKNGGKINPYHEIKCAGMSEKSKMFLRISLGDKLSDAEMEKIKDMSYYEHDFCNKKRKITDFTAGLSIPGNLGSRRIKGGVVLIEENFTIK